jgi:16S rRNA (guanine527-N7)-methyltransferase
MKPLLEEGEINWGARLEKWALCEGVKLSYTQIVKILQYISILRSWNKKIRLVGRVDMEWLLREQVVPSLLILKAVPQFETRLLDIGSGAGFPGFVCAIVRPSWQVSLLESIRKKTLFLQESRRSLNLLNVNVYCARAENIGIQKDLESSFDVSSARGLGGPEIVLRLAEKFVTSNGKVILYRSHFLSPSRHAKEIRKWRNWKIEETFDSMVAPVSIQIWQRTAGYCC